MERGDLLQSMVNHCGACWVIVERGDLLWSVVIHCGA